VAGKVPEQDVLKAQALGARGFLAAPLDTDLMLRAVRRLVRTAEEAPRLLAVSGGAPGLMPSAHHLQVRLAG
jgi:type IV pilus assembly protein PilB